MLRKAPKHVIIAELLEQRIRNGDYLLREFPTDRQLAVELDVNPRTGRKAIEALIEKGLLVRPRNGRATARTLQPSTSANRSLNIALLAPTYPSPYVERWHGWIERGAEQRQWMTRLIAYKHWDDALISDTVEQFDGVFLMPMAGEPPETLLRRLGQGGRPVVMLDLDVSQYGLPSLWLGAPVFVQRLLNHLDELGHEAVDCLDTQPINSVMTARIQQWELWRSAHRKRGRLINKPVPAGTSAIVGAHRIVTELLEQKQFTATGLFCTSAAAAIGAMRALRDAGLEVGRDVSVCAADDDAGRAPYFSPSLTCMGEADPSPYISLFLDWMARGGEKWTGPLLVQPPDVPVFLGESTGPCPVQGAVYANGFVSVDGHHSGDGQSTRPNLRNTSLRVENGGQRV